MSSALTRALRVLADCLGSSTSGRGAAAAIKAVPPSSFGTQTSGSVRNTRANRINRAASAVFEPLEERALMSTTYYVSNNGNDANRGSISAPWRSIGKVSGTHLNPGDKVLFAGGETFGGSLNLYNDGGSPTNPVVISSFGNGRATISSGGSDGAWALNSTGVTFENLVFVGSPQHSVSQNGIRIENYTSNTVRSGYTVTNCDISGYGIGIGFGADSTSEGLDSIKITNNVVHDNVDAGIESYDVLVIGDIASDRISNVYIGYNDVYNTYGDGNSFSSGSGIELQGLDGATIEHNASHDNGLHGTGVVGIWCYCSNDVLFQYNESYNNRTRDENDGDGFDFDSGTSNSIMQYNFSAHNYGGGFQLNQWKNNDSEVNDIVRYNISQGDGLKNNYAGIDIWGKVENAQVYNNTVYIAPPLAGTTQALRISNNEITYLKASNVAIVGNIFISTGGVDLVNGYSAAIEGSSGIHFAGNVYDAIGAFNIVYAGVHYTSLAAWQASTGQEKLNGTSVGLAINPMLKAVGQAVPTPAANSLSSITAYDLLPGSPLLKSPLTSIAFKALGITAVHTDFFGDVVPSTVIAGVDEHSTAATSGGSSSTVSTGSPGSGSTGSTGSGSTGSGSTGSGSTGSGSTGSGSTGSKGSGSTGSGSTGSGSTGSGSGSTGSTGSGSTGSGSTGSGSTGSGSTGSGSTGSTGGSTGSNGSTGSTTLKLTGTNVGSVRLGSSSGSGTSYTLTGGGTDIWGTTDNMRYDYTTLTGNGSIIAEVNSQGDSSSYAKAGVMIRNGGSVSSNSAEVAMLLNPDSGAEIQTRASAKASTSAKVLSSVSYKWVKLVRSGNTFSGYISANGTSWTLVGSSIVNMSSTVTIGLAVTAHDPTRGNTASFTNVSVS